MLVETQATPPLSRAVIGRGIVSTPESSRQRDCMDGVTGALRRSSSELVPLTCPGCASTASPPSQYHLLLVAGTPWCYSISCCATQQTRRRSRGNISCSCEMLRTTMESMKCLGKALSTPAAGSLHALRSFRSALENAAFVDLRLYAGNRLIMRFSTRDSLYS